MVTKQIENPAPCRQCRKPATTVYTVGGVRVLACCQACAETRAAIIQKYTGKGETKWEFR